ncbi:hypothetical protein HN415_07335 [Candidatus Woesearchaeota archaeon]|jgi:hypothetical protein|nr:hypothetical protein [Candidatus Woesearchaeota archaeon]
MINFSKSWVPIIILIIIILGIFGYFFLGDRFFYESRSPAQPLMGCVEMKNNGDYGNSIDIVFLADNFEDLNKFREITDEMVNSFFETVPYNEYEDRFNFFRIEELNNDYDCDYNYGGDAIVCEPSNIKKAAVSCPNDYPIVLVDVSGIQNLFQHLRSSAWMGSASLNAGDDPLVFTHEFAHLFANFADEYEFGGNVGWDSPNCDSDLNSCSKFDIVPIHDCVVGCVNKNHARSIKTGIMRDYWKSKVYGNYNEEILRKIIEKDSNNEMEEISKSPLNFVELQYSSGKWDIISVTKGEGFADSPSFEIGDSVEVLDSSGNPLIQINLKSPLLFSCGHDEEKNPHYTTTIIEGSKYIVGLPIFEEAEKIVVKVDNKITSSHLLKNGKIIGFGGMNSEILNIPEIF